MMVSFLGCDGLDPSGTAVLTAGAPGLPVGFETSQLSFGLGSLGGSFRV
jgi:hypothetical protein